jgi:hypothetical protein
MESGSNALTIFVGHHMTKNKVRVTQEETKLKRTIETARWHILRYDTLRQSIANRASFLISANAVLIGGVALLFPKAVGPGILGGRPVLATLGAGALMILGLATLSIMSATRALLARRTWRTLFGDDPTPSLFYQHSDTVRQLDNFIAFRDTFTRQSLAEEVDAATGNLWVVLQTHNYRYHFLRQATQRLKLGLAVFATGIATVVTLSCVSLWIH